jgi:hypothetical protein
VRAWKEIYLPILEICNSIFLGFLFFLCLKLTAFIPYRENGLLSGYPELLVFSLVALILGYLVQILSTKIPNQKKDISLLTLFIFVLAWSLIHFPRPILMETIFHGDELVLSISLIFLLVGFLISGLKEAQMGGFLVGIFIFTVLGFVLEMDKLPFKPYCIGLLFSAIINLIFRGFVKLDNQFLPSRRVRRDFKLFSGLYSSFFVLFLINLTFTSVRGFTSFQLSAFLFLISYISLRTFAIYKMDESYFRKSFILGRNLLVINFVLFAGSFTWEAFSWLLYFSLGGCLGFYRPEKPIYKKRIQTLSIGIVAILLCLGIIQLAKIQYYWIHLEVILVIFVFLPFILSFRLTPPSIHLPILISILLSVFLFKTPMVYSFKVISKPKMNISKPIPFLLTDIWDDQSKYVFIHSGLPQDEEKDHYPSLEELKGLIPIIGDENNNYSYLSYYRNYLDKNKFPYYLISRNFSSKDIQSSQLSYRSFPGFKIFYTNGVKQPNWSSAFSGDGKVNTILDKLEGIENFEEYHTALDSMEKYAYGSFKSEIQTFRRLIRDSIHSYCNYYTKNNFHAEALNCFNLMLKFGELDDMSTKSAYNSLNYSTPSHNHIDLLNTLAEVPRYKVSILKKIFPIYDSAKNYNATIETLEKLISISKVISNQNEVQSLEQELTRVYLESDKLDKAYTQIQNGIKVDKDSLIWKRLKENLDEKREAKRRIWLPPPSVDTTEIE